MRYFITITLLIISIINHAQIKHDIVYLYDGSVIHGNLLNDTSDQIAIKTFQGNIFVYETGEIKEIKNKHNNYINYTSAGILIGSALNEKPSPLSALTEHNIQFLDHFAIGAVIGIELLKETIVPLGANAKIYLPLTRRIIFIGGSVGHSFSIDKPSFEYELEDTYGGTFAGIEIGTLIPLNPRNGIFFAFGYRYNELKYRYYNWYTGNTNRTYYLNRLSLRFGIALY